MSASSSRADRADAREVEGSRDKTSKPALRDGNLGLAASRGGVAASTALGMTRDPLTVEFLRYLANERNASPRTLKAYRHALTSFRAENKTSWKKCTSDDFRDYLFAVMKRGQARSYVRLQFSALRTFYQFLAARKRLRHNPVREVLLPKMEKKLPLVLSRQQVEELLTVPIREPKSRSAPSWMPLRDVAIMELFYSSGLRLSELAALDVAEVDPYTESVRVFGKGRKERCTPLTKQTVAVLKAWLQERGGSPEEAVFPSARGARLSPDGVQYLLAKHVATAQKTCPSLTKKRISPHVLRHTAAMELLQAGVDRSVIALWLGHESVETTQIYLEANLALKEKALAKTKPLQVKAGRYRPSDSLLRFLNSL